MTDRAALLAAVLAAPEDDAPRLVYADWLDEHGEGERAELIRVQIAWVRTKQAGMIPGGAFPMVEAWLAREKDLILHRWQSWYPDCPVRVFIPPAPVLPASFVHPKPLGTVTRGFLSSVISSATDWLAHGDAILAQHPVTAVRLTAWPEHQWQMDNLPDDWTQRNGYFAEDALWHRWPSVKTWHLPPEPLIQFNAARLRRGATATVTAGEDFDGGEAVYIGDDGRARRLVWPATATPR